jgi:hypothetical protein
MIHNDDSHHHSFKIQSGPAGQPGTWQTQDWNRAGLKKNWRKKNLV